MRLIVSTPLRPHSLDGLRPIVHMQPAAINRCWEKQASLTLRAVSRQLGTNYEYEGRTPVHRRRVGEREICHTLDSLRLSSLLALEFAGGVM